MKHIVIFFLLLLGSIVCMGQDIKQLKNDAKKGDANAQAELGNCYQYGIGVTKDEQEAVYWYKKAVKQGNAVAMNSLGFCYEKGEGVSKDWQQAVYWYKKSAVKGWHLAQFNLGLCYKNGEGVPKDEQQSVYWYKKSAEQGYALAQTNLGLCYEEGIGVPKDEQQAVYWYKEAAVQGDAIAQNNLGNCYERGEGVPQDEQQAIFWYRKSANKGFAPAKKNLQRVTSQTKVASKPNNNNDSSRQRFSEYAKRYIEPIINEWQKKGEFEKTADWKKRVNEETRQAKVKELTQVAEKKYLKGYRYDSLTYSLGVYDADNEVFLVKCNAQDLLVPVPITEAQTFKKSWGRVKKEASYFVANDYPALAEVKFSVDGKIYSYNNRASLNYEVAQIDYNFAPIEIEQQDDSGSKGKQRISTVKLTAGSDAVDAQIPQSGANSPRTFAVIIGNETYSSVEPVQYAQNDAKIFAAYCQKTLGLPKKNIKCYDNATYATMRTAVNNIKSIADAFKGDINVIFYYAGHGIPNKETHDAYLLPTDADGRDTEVCYPLSKLYRELADMNARSTVVFMDACFSGAQRGEGMLALARGVAIDTKTEHPQGNMVVFSAATGEQTAYPYAEKGHGLFTYFLLKKLQESKGDCTLGELSEYVTTNVKQQSSVDYKNQTPTVVPSAQTIGWENWKLK